MSKRAEAIQLKHRTRGKMPVRAVTEWTSQPVRAWESHTVVQSVSDSGEDSAGGGLTVTDELQ